jgi:hypothetical protein
MAETAPVEGDAPPKKRSFFKKAAWQSEVKKEGSKNQDIFSHSDEYKDIVAEQERRKKEEREAKEAKEAKKRKLEEDRERKRRKISIEDEGIQMPTSGSGSANRHKTQRDPYGMSCTVIGTSTDS